jgi:O-antigen ligase
LLFLVYCFMRERNTPRLIQSLRQVPGQFGLQLLLVFWFAVSSLWSVRSDMAVVALSTFVFLIGLTWLIADFVRSPYEIGWFADAILVYGLVLAALAIWQYRTNLDTMLDSTMSFRANGINDNPNIAARYMVLALGICLAKLVLMPRWGARALSGLGVMTLLLGISATASRGGALAAAVVVLSATVFLLYHFNSCHAIRFVLLVGILIATVYCIFPDFLSSLERRFNGESTNLTGYRTELLSLALQNFQDSPMFGIGFESFRFYNLAVTHLPPHNTYAKVLVETGIVGFWIFSVMLWFAFGNIWFAVRVAAKHKDLKLNLAALVGLLFGLTGFCAAIFFGDSAHSKLFWLTLAVIQMAGLAVKQILGNVDKPTAPRAAPTKLS